MNLVRLASLFTHLNKRRLGQLIDNFLPNLSVTCYRVLSLTFNRESRSRTYLCPPSTLTLLSTQIAQFIEALFTQSSDLARFKLNIRDFLIQLKEFSGDNTDLYAEDRETAQQAAKEAERERAAKVGGLLKPSEIDQDDEL